MKKLAALLLTPVVCLNLAACAAGNTDIPQEPEDGLAAPVEAVPVSQPVPAELPEPEPVWTAAEGVTFGLLQEAYPVGTARLTLVVENRSGAEAAWGRWENYEKFVDGQWQKVELDDGLVFTDDLLILEAGEVRTMTLGALNCAEPLDEGIYRVTGSAVFVGDEKAGEWQVTFQVAADAEAEPDYALFVSREPLPLVEDCLLTEQVPVFFINTTGEDGNALDIPRLEKRNEDGAWEEVPYKENIGFCGTPSRLPAEGRSWSVDLLGLWGAQDAGEYRLSYQVGGTFETEETVSCEFALCVPENGGGLPPAPQE